MAEITTEKAVETAAPEQAPAPAPKPKKRRRRLGDRSDGRRLRTIHPMTRVGCYLMEHRNGATNRVRDRIDLSNIDKYVREKKAEGYKNFNLMHVIIAAYVRVLADQPALNRFVAGHNIFARNKVEVALTIKKEMTLESPDTVIKIVPELDMTPLQVYDLLATAIENYRDNPGGALDSTIKILNYIPGLFMLFTARLLRLFDYFGWLPKFLLNVSPFHCSMFITSKGSLGIPPINHHLYDFGNCPVFIAFGAKERKYEVNAKGEVEKKEYADYTVMMDERICDGFYYAAAMKRLRRYLRDPWKLDTPPERIVEDID